MQRGVASSTDDIVAQLSRKFPIQKNTVKRSSKDRINGLRNIIEKSLNQVDEDNCMEKIEQPISMSDGLGLESLRELIDSIENDFQAVQVHCEEIVKAASRPKKLTGGGLCQLIPRQLKAAIFNSSGNKCAKIFAQWANRWWAKGDFDTGRGALLATSRLIPINKDWESNDVRPVACGSAIRRLMGRALAEKTRPRVEGLTEDPN